MTIQNQKTKRQTASKKKATKTVNKNPKKEASSSGKNSQSAGKPADSSFTLELEAVITISEAQRLYEELQGHLDRGGDICINAGEVHMIDTAGLQLLLAFVLEVKNQNRSISWQAVSPAFKETAELLGMMELLGSS